MVMQDENPDPAAYARWLNDRKIGLTVWAERRAGALEMVNNADLIMTHSIARLLAEGITWGEIAQIIGLPEEEARQRYQTN